MFFTVYFPLLLSGITVIQTYMAGNKHSATWSLSIVNQVFWFCWIVASGSWGFLPLNALMAYMGFINHRKWQEKVGFADFRQLMRYAAKIASVADQAPENRWAKIDKNDNNAPWGELCIVVNDKAGMETVHILRRSEEFYTHYHPYQRFSKRE